MKRSEIREEEYNSYFQGYLDLVSIDSHIDTVLEDSLKDSLIFLNSIEKPMDYRYADNKWTIGQVISHMIDTERVFSYRALRFLRGDTTELPGFDQDLFAESLSDYAFAKAELIQSFETTREATLSLFKNVTADQWNRKGKASGSNMTARVIPFLLAGHALHHEKVLKERYLS